MDDKEKIAELEAKIVVLQNRLTAALSQVEVLSSQINQRYRYDQDYLPYDDDYDRR